MWCDVVGNRGQCYCDTFGIDSRMWILMNSHTHALMHVHETQHRKYIKWNDQCSYPMLVDGPTLNVGFYHTIIEMWFLEEFMRLPSTPRPYANAFWQSVSVCVAVYKISCLALSLYPWYQCIPFFTFVSLYTNLCNYTRICVYTCVLTLLLNIIVLLSFLKRICILVTNYSGYSNTPMYVWTHVHTPISPIHG